MATSSREDGQATVEHVGLVLLVAALVGVVITFGPAGRLLAPLGSLVADRIVCAVEGGDACDSPAAALDLAYGDRVAALVRANAPEVRFEAGERTSLPIDFRRCRSRACSDTEIEGRVETTRGDLSATAFVRVIDCRDGADPADADCSGAAAGNLYLQYWFYYPDSDTPPVRALGFHIDDWESFTVRLGPGGAAARASSHHGYQAGADPVSDARSYLEFADGPVGKVVPGPIRKLVSGKANDPGWGEHSDYLWVSAGSHAGRTSGGDYERWIPSGRLELIPLEEIAEEHLDEIFEVTAPWKKKVWSDPESPAT